MSKPRVHLLRALQVRAEARALLLYAGEFKTLNDAIGPLFAWAVRKGLVARHGEKIVKQIIERPFIVIQKRSL